MLCFVCLSLCNGVVVKYMKQLGKSKVLLQHINLVLSRMKHKHIRYGIEIKNKVIVNHAHIENPR